MQIPILKAKISALKPNSQNVVENAKPLRRRRKHGFEKLTSYRLYSLDGVNRVASGEWIDADDDHTAIEEAKRMMDGADCELWHHSRLVARLPGSRRNGKD